MWVAAAVATAALKRENAISIPAEFYRILLPVELQAVCTLGLAGVSGGKIEEYRI